MSHLKKYISEAVEELFRQQSQDYDAAADAIIAKMLNPNYTPKKVQKTRKNYTKVKSYQEFQEKYTNNTHQLIYNVLLKADEPLSRADIANRASIRMSTVCGRVAEMMEGSIVMVVGTKIDSDSEKTVEVLDLMFKPASSSQETK